MKDLMTEFIRVSDRPLRDLHNEVIGEIALNLIGNVVGINGPFVGIPVIDSRLNNPRRVYIDAVTRDVMWRHVTLTAPWRAGCAPTLTNIIDSLQLGSALRVNSSTIRFYSMMSVVPTLSRFVDMVVQVVDADVQRYWARYRGRDRVPQTDAVRIQSDRAQLVLNGVRTAIYNGVYYNLRSHRVSDFRVREVMNLIQSAVRQGMSADDRPASIF